MAPSPPLRFVRSRRVFGWFAATAVAGGAVAVAAGLHTDDEAAVFVGGVTGGLGLLWLGYLGLTRPLTLLLLDDGFELGGRRTPYAGLTVGPFVEESNGEVTGRAFYVYRPRADGGVEPVARFYDAQWEGIDELRERFVERVGAVVPVG